MNHTETTLTASARPEAAQKYDEIMAIALQNLAQWEPKLSPACYAALEHHSRLEWARSDHSKPYDLFRGGAMTQFILNWQPEASR